MTNIALSDAWKVIDEMIFMRIQKLRLLVQEDLRDEIIRQIRWRRSRAASANPAQFANRRPHHSLARLGDLYRKWECH